MLSPFEIDQVLSLLKADELSQREIAARVGVSRGTVNAIANGRRPEVHAARSDDDESLVFDGPVVRCPDCGGRVYAPCRLCYIRRLKAVENNQRRNGQSRGVNPTPRRGRRPQHL